MLGCAVGIFKYSRCIWFLPWFSNFGKMSAPGFNVAFSSIFIVFDGFPIFCSWDTKQQYPVTPNTMPLKVIGVVWTLSKLLISITYHRTSIMRNGVLQMNWWMDSFCMEKFIFQHQKTFKNHLSYSSFTREVKEIRFKMKVKLLRTTKSRN